jgi:tetratricopeptide (TPR) repeat protein
MSQSELEIHRKIAKKSFNEAWDVLDKKNRNANDERQMLHLAHASRYHWSFVGTARNFTVSDWQISRVYAALREPRLALHFAKSAFEIFQNNNLSDNLPSAYEGMARAYAIAKDFQHGREYISKAREQLDKAAGMDSEDKKIYSDQIRETEELIEQ